MKPGKALVNATGDGMQQLPKRRNSLCKNILQYETRAGNRSRKPATS